MLKKFFVVFVSLNILISIFAEQTRGMKLIVKDKSGQVNEVRVYDRVFGLVVGVDKYQDKTIPMLKNCVNDAKGIKNTLEKYYNFTKIEEIYDEKATSNGIYAKFSKMQSENNITDKDAFFVFIASHGVTFGQMGYIIPYDGSFNEAEQYKNIGMSDLREKIGEGIVKAKHIFYCIDACYSGSILTRGGMSTSLNQDDYAFIKEITKERVRYAITAGDKGQEVLDGGKNGHSVFTGRLIEALEEANGYITGGQLSQQIAHKVFSDAQDRGHVQNPQYGRLSGMGDFVFIKKDGDKLENAQKALDELDKQIALAQIQQQKARSNQEQQQLQLDLQKKEAERKIQQLELEQMVEFEKKRIAEKKRQNEIQAEYEKNQQAQQDILQKLQQENEKKRQLLQSLQSRENDMDSVIKQIAELSKSISDLQKNFAKTKKVALDKVKAFYAEKYAELSSMKKDKWETPAEFEERKKVEFATYRMNEANELSSVENRYDTELTNGVDELEKQIVTLQNKIIYERQNVKLDFFEYDDIKQCFPGNISLHNSVANINQTFEMFVVGESSEQRRKNGMQIDNLIATNSLIGEVSFKYMDGKFSPIGYRIVDITSSNVIFENYLSEYLEKQNYEKEQARKAQKRAYNQSDKHRAKVVESILKVGFDTHSLICGVVSIGSFCISGIVFIVFSQDYKKLTNNVWNEDLKGEFIAGMLFLGFGVVFGLIAITFAIVYGSAKAWMAQFLSSRQTAFLGKTDFVGQYDYDKERTSFGLRIQI